MSPTTRYKSVITISDTAQGCRIEATIEPKPIPADDFLSPAVAMAQLMLDVAKDMKKPKQTQKKANRHV
jgi:hypothetical protein